MCFDDVEEQKRERRREYYKHEKKKNKKRARDRKKGIKRTSTVALDIFYYQRNTFTLIPKSAMLRCIREITASFCPRGEEYRWTADAINAIHVAAENYLVKMMMAAGACARYGQRVTVMQRDILLTYKVMELME